MKELHDAEKVRFFSLSLCHFINAMIYCRCKNAFWTVRLLIFHFRLCTAHSCFIGVESAAFPGQSDEEKDRLLHMVRLTII
jgi:hypothetical protein